MIFYSLNQNGGIIIVTLYLPCRDRTDGASPKGDKNANYNYFKFCVFLTNENNEVRRGESLTFSLHKFRWYHESILRPKNLGKVCFFS